MSTLGERLREARVAKGLTPQQAELETRFRAVFVQSLEQDDLTKLPPLPFMKGLLRNYALYLGLDADQVVEEYEVAIGAKMPAPVVGISPASPSSPLPPAPHTPASPSELQLAPPPPPEEILAKPAIVRVTTPARPWTPEILQDALNSIDQTPDGIESDRESFPEPAAAPGEVNGNPRRTFPVSAEVIAIAIILLVILTLSYTAYVRLVGGTDSSQGGLQVSGRSAATPTTFATMTPVGPTPIRTFAVSPTAAGQPAIIPLGSATAVPIALPPGTPGMTLTVETQQAVWLWVITDNQEVFKGDLRAGTRTWVARSRLYLQVKNIPNAKVTVAGKSVLPANFGERSLLERAWIMNPKGTPVPVVPDASFTTPAAAPETNAPPPPSPTPTFSRPRGLTPTPPPVG